MYDALKQIKGIEEVQVCTLVMLFFTKSSLYELFTCVKLKLFAVVMRQSVAHTGVMIRCDAMKQVKDAEEVQCAHL